MIDILEITDSLITVESGGQEIEVSRDAFESWLMKTDKLDWVKDSSDHTGSHVQQTGTFDMDEYFENDRYVRMDLAEFLTTRQPMTGKIKDMVDLGKSLKKMLTQSQF